MIWIFRIGLTLIWFVWGLKRPLMKHTKYDLIIWYVGGIMVWNIGTILGQITVLLERLT